MVQAYQKDNGFIKKLTEITEANLANEQFGVAELAEKSGFSHSQIHRRLQALTKQSASQFIREIRLNIAKELLQQELLSVSEIAYRVGFGSPSYFNKCFHDYFGYPPGDYNKHEHEKSVGELTFTDTKLDNAQLETNISKTKSIFQNKLFQIVVAIILVAALSFFTFSYFNGNTVKTVRNKSIAVLPLRNLSDDSENQHLADGIMEDILNRLSLIREFEVKSRISSDVYDSPEVAVSAIAKELGVSYVLEGSLLKHGDKVRLYVQLIDAKNDNPVWSDKYDNDLSDIFAFVSDVSQQIADELQTTLSPKEKEQIGKKYTENKEAYDLYLEGRFYHRLRTPESFKKSIEYYKQALALDSNYCLAYAGLADTYLTGSWYDYYPKEEGIPKSQAYALKALSIDNNLAEAHTTLGGIATYFSYDFETAEKELKLALKINPTYVRANKVYSEYLNVVGKNYDANKFLNVAFELNPSYHNLFFLRYRYLFGEGNYHKALEASNRLFSLDNKKETHAWRNFEIYLRMGKDLEAIKEIQRLLIASSSQIEFKVVDDLYNESGMKSVVIFIIENDLVTKDRGKTDYKIARLYAFIGENTLALNYLEELCDVRIKYEHDFVVLRSEPRFIAMLQKMNLGGY